jgi:hypothetical protein
MALCLSSNYMANPSSDDLPSIKSNTKFLINQKAEHTLEDDPSSNKYY